MLVVYYASILINYHSVSLIEFFFCSYKKLRKLLNLLIGGFNLSSNFQ